MAEPQTMTLRDDRHLMPWVIPAADQAPAKTCVLVAVMEGNVMQSISLHVASEAEGTVQS